MTCNTQFENEEGSFVEFRRKVRCAEVLSTSIEQLLRILQFTGKVRTATRIVLDIVFSFLKLGGG